MCEGFALSVPFYFSGQQSSIWESVIGNDGKRNNPLLHYAYDRSLNAPATFIIHFFFGVHPFVRIFHLVPATAYNPNLYLCVHALKLIIVEEPVCGLDILAHGVLLENACFRGNSQRLKVPCEVGIRNICFGLYFFEGERFAWGK